MCGVGVHVTCYWLLKKWSKPMQIGKKEEPAKLHRDSNLNAISNQGLWSCKAAPLPTAAPYCPGRYCIY